jgi:hypothetical protein
MAVFTLHLTPFLYARFSFHHSIFHHFRRCTTHCPNFPKTRLAPSENSDESDDLCSDMTSSSPVIEDAIVKEHGLLVISLKSGVILNFLAVAAKLAETYQIAADGDQQIYRYSCDDSLWLPLNTYMARQLVFEFIKKLADDHQSLSLLGQRTIATANRILKMIPSRSSSDKHIAKRGLLAAC